MTRAGLTVAEMTAVEAYEAGRADGYQTGRRSHSVRSLLATVYRAWLGRRAVAPAYCRTVEEYRAWFDGYQAGKADARIGGVQR